MIVRRCSRADAGAPRELAKHLEAVLRAALAVYEPGLGIPLRPYLVRTLAAAAYAHNQAYRGAGRARASNAVLSLPAAMARLPHRQRQAATWRYYDGASVEEIGNRLKVRPATVRSLLRLALGRLRQDLRDTAGGGHGLPELPPG